MDAIFLTSLFHLDLNFQWRQVYFTTVLGSVGWRQHSSCDYQVTTATPLDLTYVYFVFTPSRWLIAALGTYGVENFCDFPV